MTTHLLRQARSAAQSTEMARALIWAHFDLLARTRFPHAESLAIESPRLSWQLNDVRISFVGRLDDAVLTLIAEASNAWRHEIIVPPDHARIAETLLLGLEDASLSVTPIDELMSFRHQMTALDTGWGRARTLRRLLLAYNRRVPATVPEIRIRIPQGYVAAASQFER